MQEGTCTSLEVPATWGGDLCHAQCRGVHASSTRRSLYVEDRGPRCDLSQCAHSHWRKLEESRVGHQDELKCGESICPAGLDAAPKFPYLTLVGQRKVCQTFCPLEIQRGPVTC